MKRIYRIAAGVTALAAVAYLANCLWAQPGAQPANGPAQLGAGTAYQQPQAAAAAPRVAVINMFVVLKNYQKWEFYRKELMALAKQYEDRDQAWKAHIAKESARLKDPATPATERDTIQATITKYQRDMEDNARIGSKVVSEKGEAQTVQMFKEVEDAIKSYSLSNGIHLVLSYTDVSEPAEFYSPRNITRKLMGSGNAGAACPMYIAPGMDISGAVVSMLNSRYPPAASTGAAATSPASAQPGSH